MLLDFSHNGLPILILNVSLEKVDRIINASRRTLK